MKRSDWWTVLWPVVLVVALIAMARLLPGDW
jgi:hypothetical protein